MRRGWRGCRPRRSRRRSNGWGCGRRQSHRRRSHRRRGGWGADHGRCWRRAGRRRGSRCGCRSRCRSRCRSGRWCRCRCGSRRRRGSRRGNRYRRGSRRGSRYRRWRVRRFGDRLGRRRWWWRRRRCGVAQQQTHRHHDLLDQALAGGADQQPGQGEVYTEHAGQRPRPAEATGLAWLDGPHAHLHGPTIDGRRGVWAHLGRTLIKAVDACRAKVALITQVEGRDRTCLVGPIDVAFKV